MKKKIFSLSLLAFFSAQMAFAQSREIKGKVVDEQGESLPGAIVRVNGTEVAVAADDEGNFTISLPESRNTLTIEYFEHKNNTVKVGNNNNFVTVTMESQYSGVDGAIVEAYRVTTREKRIGSAEQISAENIERLPISTITKAIEGQMAGVQVTNGSGQPGSGAGIRIRGFGSISASSNPLIVVDGTPYDGDLESINPNDVASLTILKDANATSMYGARGANGVVVVTTKRGKSGQTKINFDVKQGLVYRSLPDYDFITDKGEYLETAFDALYNQRSSVKGKGADGRYTDMDIAEEIAGTFAGSLPNLIDYLGGYNPYRTPASQLFDPTTGKMASQGMSEIWNDNWTNEILRNGLRQDYNLSVSSGNDFSDIYLSIGYLNEKGYVKASDFDRLTVRLNTNVNVTKWLKVGTNISGALSNSNYFSGITSSSSSSVRAPGGNPFFTTRLMAPIYPVYYYDAAGNRVTESNMPGGYKYDWGTVDDGMGNRPFGGLTNIVGKLDLDQNSATGYNFVIANYAEAKIVDGLTFRTNINATYNNTSYVNSLNNLHGQFSRQGGIISNQTNNMLSYTWNQLLNYNKTFNKNHDVSVLLGHENYSMNSKALWGSRQGFAVPGIDNLSRAATVSDADSYEDNATIESYFGRVGYGFAGRYSAEATFRRDGSSRFGPDVRWGNFWSVGGAWFITEESFIKENSNLNWLKSAKLKASYGTQGNENLNTNYYPWQSLYSLAYANGAATGGFVSAIGSNLLTWEGSNSFNVGVEGNVFNRLNFEVNYFNRKNEGLIFSRPLANSTGISSVLENVGDMVNRGIEVTLNGDIIKPKKAEGFRWNAGINFTHFKNEMTKMPEFQDTVISGSTLMTKGTSIYDYYIVESRGVDSETGAELYAAQRADGTRYDTTDYNTALATGRTIVGSAIPKLMGGFTSNLSYKNFDLSFVLSFSLGGKYYDAVYQELMGSGQRGQNWHKDIANRWQKPGDVTDVPRVEYDEINIGGSSSRFLIDASYLNIRSINFGYNLPTRLLSRANMSNLRVYVAVDNVWLFSKRRGMDPQQTFGGVGNYYYNPARTVNFGLQLGL